MDNYANFQIEAGGRKFGWGALINYHRKTNPADPLKVELIYILDVALVVSPESAREPTNIGLLRPPDASRNERGVVEVFIQFNCDFPGLYP
jgi:hypothetical protein